ncbi:energy transducer TonB [Asaia prunellae]|uniref:energy transducer TonB n=1 Tax=Asaia prunellae TaxID=610245 RepID=UPI000472362C|nr:energy transducer TonB [Asaia prunellae]
MNAIFFKRGLFFFSIALLPACSATIPAKNTDTGFVKSKRISGPNPYYPFDAFKNAESANLVLKVNVDRDGNPHNCRITHSSNSRFDASALQFCQRSGFRAATMNGVPVEDVDRDFPVNYSMD